MKIDEVLKIIQESSSCSSYKEQVKHFRLHGMKFLGNGAHRDVYDCGDGMVVKVRTHIQNIDTTDPWSIYWRYNSNKREYKFWTIAKRYKNLRKTFVPVIHYNRKHDALFVPKCVNAHHDRKYRFINNSRIDRFIDDVHGGNVMSYKRRLVVTDYAAKGVRFDDPCYFQRLDAAVGKVLRG